MRFYRCEQYAFKTDRDKIQLVAAATANASAETIEDTLSAIMYAERPANSPELSKTKATQKTIKKVAIAAPRAVVRAQSTDRTIFNTVRLQRVSLTPPLDCCCWTTVNSLHLAADNGNNHRDGTAI